jgi:hypothetical protein
MKSLLVVAHGSRREESNRESVNWSGSYGRWKTAMSG